MQVASLLTPSNLNKIPLLEGVLLHEAPAGAPAIPSVALRLQTSSILVLKWCDPHFTGSQS